MPHLAASRALGGCWTDMMHVSDCRRGAQKYHVGDVCRRCGVGVRVCGEGGGALPWGQGQSRCVGGLRADRVDRVIARC